MAWTHSAGRRRPTGAVLALITVVAVVIGAVTLIGFLLLREHTTPHAAVTATSESAQPAGLSATAPTESATGTSPPDVTSVSSDPLPPPAAASTLGISPPESLPAAAIPPAANPEPTPAEPTPAEPSGPEPGTPESAVPVATDLAAAVTAYFALMPAGTDEGWARLTPGFQTGIARNRSAGYPLISTQRMGIETNSHMCGTAVAGVDPATSVLTPDCRSHDVDDLWLVDASFFPSSAALNPALTIAANALRVAPKIAAAQV